LGGEYRRFAPSTCAVEQAWSTTVFSGDTWTETGLRWDTMDRPSQLDNGKGIYGVQKPGIPNPWNPHRAATEKIVADLAFVLDLPVPPVTLWDRGPDAGEPRFVSVSAWAFEQPFTWRQIEAFLTREQLQQMVRPASAMIPFEEWVGATDRQNGGNVLVGFGPDDEAVGAWIDYGFSLHHVWRGNSSPDCSVRDMYPACGTPDKEAMKSSAERIAAVDRKTIEGIINRVPPDYLPAGVAENIRENLFLRQSAVHELWGRGATS
jgi:hypothetical protein